MGPTQAILPYNEDVIYENSYKNKFCWDYDINSNGEIEQGDGKWYKLESCIGQHSDDILAASDKTCSAFGMSNGVAKILNSDWDNNVGVTICQPN